MTEPLLTIESVSVSFGGVAAVSDVSLTVAQGEWLGVIGPNGAGKTTLLNAISGIVRRLGHIEFRSVSLDGLPPHRLAWMGIGRTFQLAEHFRDFTLIQYVMLGEVAQRRPALVAAGLATPAVRRREGDLRERAHEVLAEFDLSSFAARPLRVLPYGYQKLADVCRVLLSGPELILFDEPTSGCALSERTILLSTFPKIRSRGIATLLVDHDADFVSKLVGRLILMDNGSVVAEGTPQEVLGGQAAATAYLGSTKSMKRPGPQLGGTSAQDHAASPDQRTRDADDQAPGPVSDEIT